MAAPAATHAAAPAKADACYPLPLSLSLFPAQTLESPSCPVDIGRRVDHDALVNMVTAAVSAFLHNGLYESTKRFLSTAQGSFGLCVSCSLDVDRVALAAWNQPMSIGFAPTRNLVVYGSESNAVKVPLPGTRPDGTRLADGETAISHRLDIDNVDGEARARIRWRTAPWSLTPYRLSCALLHSLFSLCSMRPAAFRLFLEL